MAENRLLKEAIDFLAARCDGATSKDHQGFNGGDAYMGHILAQKPYENWSPKMRYIAYKMLKKYRSQLSEGGIDFSQIPAQEKPSEKKAISTQTAIKKKIVEIEGHEFVFSFPYDPMLVDAIKQLPGRKWDGQKKVWRVPIPKLAENLEGISKFVQNYGFDVSEDVYIAMQEEMEEFESNLEASAASDAEIEVPGLALELYPFQKAGVAYAVKNERVFIADEMGLGKTVQAIATIQKLAAYPALVVCPASLKFNWEKEWNTWAPDKSISVWNGKGDPAEVVVINYDMLKKRLPDLKAIGFKIVVFDESHYLKNKKAQRTVAALNLVEEIRYRLLLTGTPIVNRPVELVSQLNIMGRLKEFGGFWQFVQRYCGAEYTRFGLDVSGAQNLKELNERLRGSCLIRREKKEVMKELPDKRKVTMPIEIDNRKEYDQAEKDLIEWVGNNALKDKAFLESIAHLPWEERERRMGEWQMDAEKRAERAEYLVRIEALKQLTAKGKMKQAKEWISDFIESGEKLVVFATHKAVVNEIAQEFKCRKIMGDTPAIERQKIVEDFQNNPDTKIIVLNIKAGGVGLTLTASSNVLFLEYPWTPADLEQAIDRTHRIGQKNAVTAWFLVGQDTIDEEILDLLGIKERVVSKTTNGEKRERRKIIIPHEK